MKRALPPALRLALLPALMFTAPAAAQEQITPNRLTLGQGSTIQLQGWTRLNGTTDFATTPAEKVTTPVAPPDDRAARRARLLAAEAEYQKQKKKAKSGW